MSWLYLAFAIACEVVGTSALAKSEGFSRLEPTLVSLTAFAVSFYLLSLALITIPVGIAYAIWSGAGIVIISLIGFVFLDQRLDNPALIGIGLIIAGVLVINLFSSIDAH